MGNNKKNKKKLSIFTKIGLIILALAIILEFISNTQENKYVKTLDDYQTITNEDDLRAAMEKDTETYIVSNATLTGDPCQDPLGIMAGQYIILEYEEYQYQRRTGKPTGYWYPVDEIVSKSDNLKIYGDISLDLDDYELYTGLLNPSEEDLKPGVWDKMKDDEYYPEGVSEEYDNIRYDISGVEAGRKIAFVAEVGNGVVKPINLKGDGAPSLAYNNDPEYLVIMDYDSVPNTSVAAAILFVLAIIVFAGNLLVYRSPRKKKAKKRTPNQAS